MKTNSTFKLKKQTKMIAAGILDKASRRRYLNMMIDAQLAAEAADRQPLKMKDKE